MEYKQKKVENNLDPISVVSVCMYVCMWKYEEEEEEEEEEEGRNIENTLKKSEFM